MKNGNATFRGWLHLCVLLLAVFPALVLADTEGSWNGTVSGDDTGNTQNPGYDPSNPSKPLNVTATLNGTWTYSGPPGGPGTFTVYYTPGTSWPNNTPGIYLWRNGTWDGLMTGGSGSGVISATVTNATSATIAMRAGANQGGAGTAVWNLTSSGGSQVGGDKTLTISLTVKNNLNRAQTISCTGVASQQLGAWQARTLTFTVTGSPGTVVNIGSGPDTLLWSASYDPLVIGYSDGSAQRSGHVGEAPATKYVHAVFINYATVDVAMVPVIDGGAVGVVNAAGSADGFTPKSTSYDWNLELSVGSSLTFEAPAGHTASVQATQAGDMWSYVVTIDKGATVANNSNTTTDPTSGTTTTTTTDPTTGTTTIDRASPNPPTNTNTNPGAVFGGANTGTTGTGNTYTNTTPNAGSAANQDAANSLAGMAADIKRIRENSDAERQDRDSAVTSENKAALKDLLAQYSNSSAAATGLMGGVQSSANQASANASAALSAKIGTASMDNLDTPSAPKSGTVDMKIGPGKTITVNLNPFAPDGPLGGLISKAAAFIKRLIAWALVAAFFYEVVKEIRGVCGAAFLTGGYTSQTVDMVKSVNIFGTSVGAPASATVKVALLAIVVALVLTLPAAALAALEGGLPWSSLRDVYTQGAPSAGGGMLADALGYADYVIPWRLLLSLPLYYILIHNVLFPFQIFWHMVFKFLP